jgi:hypothetical protein
MQRSSRERSEIGYRGSTQRRLRHQVAGLARRVQLTSRQKAVALLACACVAVLFLAVLLSSNSDASKASVAPELTSSFSGARVVEALGVEGAEVPLRFPQLNQSSVASGSVDETAPPFVGVAVNAAYAPYLSKSQRQGVLPTPGIVEADSTAYVVRSVKARMTLEFGPGGECALVSPAHWQVCAPSPKPAAAKGVQGKAAPAPLLNASLQQTAWGEPAAGFIDRVLRAAWGASPPRIDAVVRTGSYAAEETVLLLESMALFWPRFLGDVVIVLDDADRGVRESIVPSRFASIFSIRVLYELSPCLPPRIWSQVTGWRASSQHSPCRRLHPPPPSPPPSFPASLLPQISNPLLADRYSDAPLIAFFDSDAALHTPVTPDYLFSTSGDLLFVHGHWQEWKWRLRSDFFTAGSSGGGGSGGKHPAPKPGSPLPNTARMADYGHGMITMPVMLQRQSLPAFRRFVAGANGGTCYQNRLSAFWDQYRSHNYQDFCTLCQISVFVAHESKWARGGAKAAATSTTPSSSTSAPLRYALIDADGSTPYLRYGIHVSYEAVSESGAPQDARLTSPKRYAKTVATAAREGLCRAFGDRIFSGCAASARFSYLSSVRFHYTTTNLLARTSTPEARALELSARLQRLGAVAAALAPPSSLAAAAAAAPTPAQASQAAVGASAPTGSGATNETLPGPVPGARPESAAADAGQAGG